MGAPYLTDTIAAIATAAGAGAVAIVRLSGPDAFAVARRVLRNAAGGELQAAGLESHRARLARFRLSDRASGDGIGAHVVDEVLVLPMRKPRSYTGEDVVEIQCHGGRTVPRLVLERCLAAGARVARAGEFTERAFLNGRLDLARAEAVAALIEARTTAAAHAAARQVTGELSQRLTVWRQDLLDARALAEVSLDFADEDLPDSLESDLRGRLDALQLAISALAATWESGRRLRDGATVVLLGAPNAGKSSLFNALLGRQRAIVAAEPGTTRDWIEEEIAIGGVAVLLRDTAGVRTAEEAVEQAGIRAALELARGADLTLLLLDGARTPDDNDRQLVEATQNLRRLIVRTKADLAAVWGPTDGVLPQAAVSVSALEESGLTELRAQVAGQLLQQAETDGLVVLHERHALALARAASHLETAGAILRSGRDLEIVALEIGAAMAALDEILGQCDVEDLLDRIFSRFCVGK